LLIHGKRPIDEICNKFKTRKDKYVITKTLRLEENPEEVREAILKSYESGECNAVILGDIPVAERDRLLKFCYGHSVRVYMMPKISDVVIGGAEILHVFDSPLLLTREYSLTMEQRFFKRLIDVVCALILLVLASPIMLLTAIAVKLYDGGPILYKQTRCTLDRREFRIMKFRSMCTDAEKDGVARLAKKNDSRITPIGKFIRKCRLDELPQLLNILKGDMSFIGPRPERPEIAAQYHEELPEFALRLQAKAGLTGYAQVYGKYNTTPYDKLQMDLMYIAHPSLLEDLKIIFATVKILFMSESTEGISAGASTALEKQEEEKIEV
jgi:exopolysaccharide biosynthesis polyprenyl glycosylphosphotransferase